MLNRQTIHPVADVSTVLSLIQLMYIDRYRRMLQVIDCNKILMRLQRPNVVLLPLLMFVSIVLVVVDGYSQNLIQRHGWGIIMHHRSGVRNTVRRVPLAIHESAASTSAADVTNEPKSSSSSSPSTKTTTAKGPSSRTLGSQELLMLPRQYPIGKTRFPQMNHVSCVTIKSTDNQPPIDISILRQAIDAVIQTHPLLSSYVVGDGEPVKRIDAFQMVRSFNEPEPFPLQFVVRGDEEVMPFTSNDVLIVIDSETDLDSSWKESFVRDLDDGSWCNISTGPMWKIELHQSSVKEPGRVALVFTFNHAISDQSSVNRMVDQMLRYASEIETHGQIINQVSTQAMPLTLEDSVLGIGQRWSDVQANGISFKTISYVAGKTLEGFKNPVILPDSSTSDKGNNNDDPLGALTIISGRTAGGQDTDSSQRKSMVEFRSLSKDRTSALVSRCRMNGVSISNALTAAITYTASDFVGNIGNDGKSRNYKVLQSLDMRRFGAQLDKAETVACMAGSHDLILGPLIDGSGSTLRKNPSEQRLKEFWSMAMEGKLQTQNFVDSDGPSEAVRVFDFAMTISDLNNLVHLTAQSKSTKGRAYSAGVTNAGVYERQQAFPINGESQRGSLKIKHGRLEVEDVFFATPHVTSGCLYQVSGMTVNGSLKLTFHPVSPIVDSDTSAKFAEAFIDLLEKVSGEAVEHVNDQTSVLQSTSKALPLAAVAFGLVGLTSHASAWAAFFSSVLEMKNNVADPADFWSALNFWIFFAVGHPILQPILWISDILHGSPGPMIAGLIPVSFLVGNIIAIAAFAVSKEVRNAVNIAAFSAFLTYVGAGLDGTAGLGDFNLALDDSYRGQIVKGCPAYDDVRQESMNDFNLEKYQGLWYEHKFHDWTQFKEVYDTTLDIRLTDGGLGWIDDFAVKGPAPDAAPLSWDKSPVANGAHYFLFGRVDPNDPKGILRESGFGVEFPNYIVDVKKDANGQYVEAIQFQCLERGGVRVFEGINFMSRSPTMSDTELSAMHQRAEKAGMYSYGASPDQMHTVARRPTNAPPIDNNWQAMWRAIGVDKLLELLTKSIEDGGR